MAIRRSLLLNQYTERWDEAGRPAPRFWSALRSYLHRFRNILGFGKGKLLRVSQMSRATSPLPAKDCILPA